MIQNYQLAALNAELDKLRGDFDNVFVPASAELRRLAERNAELEQDNASLREQNTMLDKKLAELERVLDVAREAIAADLDPGYECVSRHPKLCAALSQIDAIKKGG